MTDLLPQLALGLGLGLAVGGLAYAAGALTGGGALAAALVGALCYGVGGLAPAVLLLLFFVPSSLWSRVGGARKQAAASGFQKSGPRDQGQVLANGAVAAVLAVGYGLSGQLAWLVGVAGALAAASADTWGTELGVLSSGQPRLITNGRPVAAGSSGAISALGTLAAVAGAGFIAAGAALSSADTSLLGPVVLGGFLASLLDSVLGATLQASYRCVKCGRTTEAHPTHSCGGATQLQGGWRWLGNDQVNLLASAAGALLAWLLWG